VYFLFQSLSCVMCAVLLSSVTFFFPAHSHGRAFRFQYRSSRLHTHTA
jgi:hypothetical protein